MSVIESAREELELAGLFDKDSDYGGNIGTAVMELMELLAKQGHTSSSARWVVQILSKIVHGEIISPLEDREEDWQYVADCPKHGGAPLYQHKRCGEVFKSLDDIYYIDGYVFTNAEGQSYTGEDSFVRFSLPGMPPKTKVLSYEESRDFLGREP